MSPYRVFELVNALGANCKSTVEVARELRPKWSGILGWDERSVFIRGEEYYLWLGVDVATWDIVHWDLQPEENTARAVWFLAVIAGMGYPFRGVVTDIARPAEAGVRLMLAGQPHQYCTEHEVRAVEYFMKYQAEGVGELAKTRLMKLTEILCRCRQQSTAERARAYLRRNLGWFRKEGLGKRAENLLRHFPHLMYRFEVPGMPGTNNQMEAVIRILGRRLDPMDGYQSYETAINSLKLLVMHYRFKKFSCSRQKGHNGKSPLELAGVDTRGLSWVRYSQRRRAVGCG